MSEALGYFAQTGNDHPPGRGQATARAGAFGGLGPRYLPPVFFLAVLVLKFDRELLWLTALVGRLQ